VYSLGASLYECIALTPPFRAPTRERLYELIRTKEPSALGVLCPTLPPDLSIVVATALEKDRNRRYQTALDFAEDLRPVRANEPIVAKPVGRMVRFRKWVQRNRGLATALSALFVALTCGLCLALFLLTQRDHALGEVTTERNEKQIALADYD